MPVTKGLAAVAGARVGVLGGVAVALVALIACGFFVGSGDYTVGDAWHALLGEGEETTLRVIRDERIPRTLLAATLGAALGVAGAVMQGLTRNPLADPGILGVNAGAGFAVTIGVGIFGLSGVSGYVWFAFLGAAAATVFVYFIASGGRAAPSPVPLVLAGVALGAVLGGISAFVALIDPDTFRSLRNWGIGSIERTGIDDTFAVAPFLVVGLLIALALGGTLNSITLGDDLAASLGTHVVRARMLGLLAVTLLAGGATALTGGIAFLGLMVPHIVRWIVGPDQRWILPYAAIAASVIVLGADVIGRVIARPSEIEVGILIALIGAPVLIALVRQRKASAL